MKRLFLILLASLALLVAHDSNRIHADEEGSGIPLSNLTGPYASSSQGSVTICFNASFTATQACSTAPNVAVGNSVAVGQGTSDNKNNCATSTTTFSLPGDTSPTTPQIQITVVKTIDYDPATGSGDNSFTTYIGGKCVGAKFDSTGATVFNTGTQHFVASNGGKRVDSVVTTLTDSDGDIGAFNLSGVGFKQ